MKNGRQRQILNLISNYNIETQEDLINRLRECGYIVTQATVSRDIKELKLVKVLCDDNTYKYAQSKTEETKPNAKFSNILIETVISADSAGNIAVIKTYNGMAMAAGAAIDSIHWEGIVGSIAGDDTIFIVMRTDEYAEEIARKISAIISVR